MSQDSAAPATKQDVALLMKKMGELLDKTQSLIAASEERLKEEMKVTFECYLGKLYKDYLGATEDELTILKETDVSHNQRITKLEHQVGLMTTTH